MARRYRIGAIDLSLGFVVTIVFAVVLLSLAVMWIQSMFAGFTDLSDQLKQESSLKLEETFQESDQNYDIWPNRYEVKPNTRLAVTAGIKNNAMDAKRHTFLVSVQKMSAPQGTDPMKWLDWAKPSKTVNPNDNAKIPIQITVPPGTVTGTYIFRITACSECAEPRCPPGGQAAASITQAMCTPDSLYVWGAASEDFVLIII